MAQYWKNSSELSHNEKIFSEFLNQVIEKSVLMIIKMNEIWALGWVSVFGQSKRKELVKHLLT